MLMLNLNQMPTLQSLWNLQGTHIHGAKTIGSSSYASVSSTAHRSGP